MPDSLSDYCAEWLTLEAPAPRAMEEYEGLSYLLGDGRGPRANMTSSECHSIGGNCRVLPSSATLVCRCPHERQSAPIWLISVSLEISFSRVANEPATTGPWQLSHKQTER